MTDIELVRGRGLCWHTCPKHPGERCGKANGHHGSHAHIVAANRGLAATCSWPTGIARNDPARQRGVVP